MSPSGQQLHQYVMLYKQQKQISADGASVCASAFTSRGGGDGDNYGSDNNSHIIMNLFRYGASFQSTLDTW